MADSMASGWYFSRRDAAATRQEGPFAWEQLWAHAQAGTFSSDDMIWNSALPDWIPAALVPGLYAPPAPSATSAAPHLTAGQTGTVAPAASLAAGALAMAAGLGGLAPALPWRTSYGGSLPDVRNLVMQAALPAAQRAVGASLRRPGLALAVTTVMDLLATLAVGGADALPAALPRLLAAAVTVVLSLITGAKRGPLRTVTGVVSVVTGLIQLTFAGWALIQGLGDGESWLTILPPVIAMLSSLAMTVKTAIVALRR